MAAGCDADAELHQSVPACDSSSGSSVSPQRTVAPFAHLLSLRFSLSVEAWVRIVDVWNTDHALLAYSEFDGSVTPPYSNPDGAQIRLRSSGIRSYRGEPDSCSSGCLTFNRGWFHYASTWSAATSHITQYVDGVIRSNNTAKESLGQFGVPLTSAGSMILGQEPDSFAGLFDENQALDAMVDGE